MVKLSAVIEVEFSDSLGRSVTGYMLGIHTFVTKYVRSLCEQHGITVDCDKALHSLFGEYVTHIDRERPGS